VNKLTNNTKAYIDGVSTISADGSVAVQALDNLSVVTIAGSLAISFGFGALGIANSDVITDNDVLAYIGNNSRVDARGNQAAIQIYTGDKNSNGDQITQAFNGVAAVAVSYEDVTNIAIAGAGAETVAVGGSVIVTVMDETTSAYIGAGAVINAANTYQSGFDSQSAVDGGAETITLGAHGFVTGDAVRYSKNSGANSIGLSEGVTYYVVVDPLDSTKISLSDSAPHALAGTNLVNLTPGGSAEAQHNLAFLVSSTQGVHVLASDDTDLGLGAGGVAIALGSGGGLGAAVDVTTLTKNTTAYIGDSASVKTRGNTEVRAVSSEKTLTVAISIAFSTGVVGIAATTNVHTYYLNTVAHIGSLATVYAGGNVVVSAEDKTGADIITGSAGIAISGEGSGGVGAAVGVVYTDKTVEAYIGAGAIVDAEANGADSAVYTGEFSINFYEEGNDGTDVHQPETTNREANDDSIIRQRNSLPTSTTMRGVAVTAINRDDIEMIAVGGSGGLYFGLQVSAAIAVLRADTFAHIDNTAQINQNTASPGSAQSVLVAAGSDTYHFGVAGSLAVGAGAVGPGIHTLDINNNTKATIGHDTSVDAKEDITVKANAREDVLSISISLAGGGFTVGGAVSVVDIQSNTYASIGDNATIFADGNILISATDITKSLVIAGALSYSGGGIGAGVGVTLIHKDTQAYIGIGSEVTANGNSANTMTVFSGDDDAGNYKNGDNFRTEMIVGLAVQAYTEEWVFTIAANGGVSGGGSIAGAIAYEEIESDTVASIGTGTSINPDLTNAAAGQTVNVAAVNMVDVFVVAGVIILGGGITGGVDVGIIHNDTVAVIANGANVSARQDVEVNALADKDIFSIAISVALGSVGIAGAVDVWAIGGDLDSNSISSLNASDDSSSEDPAYGSIGAFADSNELLDLALQLLNSMGDETSAPTTFNTQASVDSPEDTITFGADHGYTNGDAVVYDTASGAQNIGLTDGTIYYVVVVSDTKIKLANSRKEALGYQPAVINLTASASGETHEIALLTDNTVADTNTSAAQTVTRANATATFDPVAGVSGTQITLEAIGDLQVGDALQYSSAGENAIGGLTNDTAYYIVSISGNQIELATAAGGTALNLTALGSSAASLHSFSNGVTSTINATTVPTGTSATIGTGTTITAGRNVEVVAVEYIDALLISGALGIGNAGIGGAVTVINVSENVIASVGGTINAATIITTGDILILANFNETINGHAYAGGAGMIGIAAQIVSIKDSGTIKATLVDSSVIEKADDVTLNAKLTQTLWGQSIGGAIGAVAVGVSIVSVTSEGTVETSLGDGVQIGQTVGKTVGDLFLALFVSTTGFAQAIAVAAGAGISAAGVDTDADLKRALKTKIGNNAQIKLSGNLSMSGVSEMDADARAVGVAVDLNAAVGVSLADAYIKPDIDTYIGTGGTIEVGGAISLTSRHNINDSGNTIDKSATVLGVAGGGGLLAGGAGANASAEANPTLDTYVASTTRLQATGAITLQSLAYNRADAQGFGIGVGLGLGVGAVLVDAKANGSNSVYMLGNVTDTAGTASGASSLTLTAKTISNATVFGLAAAGGLVGAGAGVDAEAQANPTVNAYIKGDTIRTTGAVLVQALSETNAETDGYGIAVGGLAIGVSLADATASPTLNAKIGCDAAVTPVCSITGVYTTSGSITVRALNNMDTAGTVINNADSKPNGAYAYGNPSGGGILSGNGAEVNATASAALDMQVGSSTTLSSGGALNLSSYTSNMADAQGYGVVIGGLTVGAILTDAIANGSVKARLEGNVTSGTNLTVETYSINTADNTENLVAAGGIISGNGLDMDANANPTIDTYISGNVNSVSGNILVRARSEGNAHAEGNGVTVGVGISIGATLGDATVSPTINTYASGSTVKTTGGTITIQTLHNMTSGGVEVNNAASKPKGAYVDGVASGGGVLAGNGVDVDATASPTINTYADGTLNATGAITLQTLSSHYADAIGEGITVGVVGVGVILVDANANGTVKTYITGNVTGGSNLTIETKVISDADATDNSAPGGGFVSGNGLDVDAHASPTIKSYVDDSSSLTGLTGTVNINTYSEGNAAADAKAITIGLVAAIGTSLADAEVKPNIETKIGSGATVTTTGGGIHLRSLHNFTTGGAIIQNGAGKPNGAYVEGVASGGGILGGNGVDINAVSSPAIDTFADGTLSASGAISLTSRSSQKAYAEAESASGGVLAIGVVLVDANANGTIKTHIDGNITSGTTVTLETYVVADAESPENNAPTGGLIAANGVDADTHADPTIKTYIDGSSSLTGLSGTVSLTSRSEGAAFTSAETGIGGGIALGNILTDAYVNPNIESYIGASAVVSTGGGITVASYHNYWNGAVINKRAYAYAEASGGGVIGVNISHSYSEAKANIKSYADTGSVLDAGGDIKIEAIAHNKTYADSDGVAGGALGVGESKATALSEGLTQAYLNGNVRDKDVVTNPGARNVTINASTFDDAQAMTVATAGGIVAGSGSYAPAHAYSTTKAYTADSISIVLLGDLTISALGTPKTYSSARGYGGGAVSVGVSEAEAYSSVTVLAWLGAGANVTGGVRVLNGGTLTFENYADQTQVVAVMSGTPNLTFSNDGSGRATIQRSSGSFTTEGFAANQTIYITNSSGVTNSYVIYSLTSSTLTLTTQAVFSGTVVTGASMKGTIPSSLTVDATMSGVPNITFANGGQAVPDTITRSTGSWITDGFAAGQDIQVLGAGNTNSGIYKIESLTFDILTLQQTNSLGDALNVTGVSVLAFHATPDSIARTSGSWLTDGFLVNDVIRVSGTADNDGNYTIAEISALKISLDTVGAFTDATLSSGVTITLYDRPSTTNDGGNVTISAGQALPASGHSAYSYANNQGGGIISINATDSEARRESDSDGDNMTRAINAHIDNNATLDVIGTVTVSVGSQTDQKAETNGQNGGVLAVGSNPANASSTSEAYAYVGNDVKITATKLVVSADGKDTNFADSTAGTGGIVSVAAADSEVDDNANVKAYLGSTSSAARKIVVDTLELKAVHLSTFNSTADGFAISIVGYGGAISTNTINPQVRAEFNGTWVDAANISLTATSEHKKDWLANDVENAYTIGGALIDAPAAKSVTTISGTTGIFINDGTKLTQTGEAASAGTFEANVLNKIFARDRATVHSGGALPFPRVRSEVAT
ncbi:MAG: hypothetical protein H8D34_25770, partial [Chloroflexi bacterium]|nr:hypothetical protein [Chloroflexota bacterium]